MSKPIVAIVGRPNVGKSTLFNTLAGEKISIVKDYPGVTRDRIYADITWLDHSLSLIDTGGIEMDSKDAMLSHMREQANIAIETADVIMFVTDVRQGLVDADFKVADMLRKSGKPVILVVNKVDNFDKFMPDVYEFYNLGIGEPHPVSASSKLGLGDMLDAVWELVDAEKFEEEEDDRPKIAIVGKPNAGKSSLINKLIGKDRVIVSDIAGTTRDAIDTEVVRDGKEYIFIDTAGLRRKNKIKEDLERYSIIRTVAAIERSDVVILMIDAVVKEYTNKVREVLSFVPYAEIVFISALTGQRTNKLFEYIEKVIQFHSMRIQTGVLNEILMEAVAMQQPPSDKGKRLKLFYMTQVSTKPPTFVLFVNSKELMHFSYQRYIENRIRDTFGFIGTPIRMFIRERKEK